MEYGGSKLGGRGENLAFRSIKTAKCSLWARWKKTAQQCGGRACEVMHCLGIPHPRTSIELTLFFSLCPIRISTLCYTLLSNTVTASTALTIP